MLTAYRVAASLLSLFAGLYWLAIVTRDEGALGVKILVGVVTAGATVMLVTSAARGRASQVVRTLALAAGLAVFGGAFLLNRWVGGDYDRYVWIIRQLAPCTYMGGGPGQLWVLAMATAYALGAVGHALVGGLDRRHRLIGVAIASALLALAALAMFPHPAIFATLLGCL